MSAPSAGAARGAGRSPAGADERGEQVDLPETGLGDTPDQALCDDLWIGVHALALLDASARHAGRLEPLEPRRGRLLRKRARDRRRQIPLHREDALVFWSDVRRLDRRIVETEQREERTPLREVEAGDGDEPVGGLEAAVVRVHRDAARDLVRSCSKLGAVGGPRAGGLPVQPDEILELHRERGGEERDVDELALARLPGAHESGEHARGEQEPCGEVGHRDSARPHGHVVAPRRVRREEPGASLGDEVVRRRVRERPRLAERAHASDHEHWMRFVHGLPVEPEPRGPLAREVVQHDGGAAKKLRARLQPVGRLEVGDDGALPAVQRDEVAADAGRDGHDVAVAVPGGRLDLDDVGAEICEEHAAERPGDVLRVLDDAHAFKRERHPSPSPRRAMTTCRISAEPPEIVEPTAAR